MSDTINKAIEALRASINYINESPCDPDITAMQIVAYDIYLKSNPEQVLADLKAWQAAQAQAVNQQLLEAIKVCASFLSDFGLENSDAYQQALFAIAAAQEVGNE